MPKRWTTAMLNDAKAMTSTELSRKYKISIAAARLGVKRYGIELVKQKPGGRIFYAEDVADIFELKTHGLASTEISTAYGVKPASIRFIISKAVKHGFDAYPPRPKEVA